MKNRSAIAAGLVAAVIAVFIVLLATSDTQQTGSVNFEILGDVAPQISGPTLDGDEYSLLDERGDWVVVNFFASWCVGCRVEHPELVEFTERHQGDGVQLVAVMFGDTETNAREFFNELGGDWPALVEDTGRIAIDYGVTAVPETVLISPSGRVVQKWIGTRGVTADNIDAVIAQLEGGG
jgi:cytochrome c biogenesis protein CcmG/thiol:disulfide interchange protein DsbE